MTTAYAVLSIASRGKNEFIIPNEKKIYSPVGNLAERAKIFCLSEILSFLGID